MIWAYLLLLSAVQGATEFLPISSSAHLILTREAFAAMGVPLSDGSRNDEMALDIALHVGSLGAIVLHFRKEVGDLLSGLADLMRARGSAKSHLLVLLVVATLPITIVGFLLKDVVTYLLRSPEIIAWMTIVFGLLLLVADRQPQRHHGPETMSWKHALAIGLAQCLALVPGVSRSGIAMTAGRLAGFDRPLSARFALLMALPTIAGAGLVAGIDLHRMGDARLTAEAIIGGLFAFASAWIAVSLMMAWLQRFTFLPFVVYRIVLGAVLLWLIYGLGWQPSVPA
jgi:undecaprenyl-diphosphatase